MEEENKKVNQFPDPEFPFGEEEEKKDEVVSVEEVPKVEETPVVEQSNTIEEKPVEEEKVEDMIDPSLVTKPKKKSYAKIYIIVGVITAVIIAGMAFVFFMTRVQYKEDYFTISLTEGYSVSKVYEVLEEQNVIKSAFCAKVWATVSGQTNYKIGQYSLPRNVSAFKIVSLLAETTPK